MNSLKIFCILAISVLANARVVKRQKKVRICQNPRPISVIELPCAKCIEPRTLGPCNCQNLILQELANGCSCGCVETFSILNAELSKNDRLIKLPKGAASFEANLPAINLPVIDFLIGLPCQQPLINLPREAIPYPILDSPCACRKPIVEYIPQIDLPCPKLRNPYVEAQAIFIEPPSNQPQVIQLPGLPIDCNCNKPCKCQKACDNAIKVLYGLPGLETPVKCGCGNRFGPLPCPCQGYQLPAVDLPDIGYVFPPIPAPEVGCGKYLRQVTLPPPFL